MNRIMGESEFVMKQTELTFTVHLHSAPRRTNTRVPEVEVRKDPLCQPCNQKEAINIDIHVIGWHNTAACHSIRTICIWSHNIKLAFYKALAKETTVPKISYNFVWNHIFLSVAFEGVLWNWSFLLWDPTECHSGSYSSSRFPVKASCEKGLLRKPPLMGRLLLACC